MTPPFPDRKYSVILADPPWAYSHKHGAGPNSKPRGGAVVHYQVMDVDAIAALHPPSGDDAVLLLWATFPHLPEALQVMDAWGFTYKTAAFVWVKETDKGSLFTGLGSYTRANAEVVLLGLKGKGLPRIDRSVKQVILAPRGRHSEKPAEVRDRIVRLYGDVPRIELFARQRAQGWDSWGLEVPPE